MKSTFQKPDATYPHGSLREQPDWDKPERDDYATDEIYKLDLFQWQDDLENCRTIPCSENNWKDGQELTQDVDYTLEYTVNNKGDGLIAVPAVSQKTEDQLWEELINEINTTNKIGASNRVYFSNMMAKLKSKYFIKRKTS